MDDRDEMSLNWGAMKATEFTFPDGSSFIVERGGDIVFNAKTGEVKAGYYAGELYGDGLKSASLESIKIGERRNPSLQLKRLNEKIKNGVRLWPRQEKELERLKTFRAARFIK